MQATVDNKRVAKNAVTLYFRMLFQMAVYLYTSRVVINVLGFTDYGIYDVVGGVVGLLTFLNNSMTTCTQRFITFAIGRNVSDYLNKVYSVSITIHVLLAFGVLLIGETVGLWYIHHYMVIPVDRFQEALIVYHCSLLSAMCMIVSVPYNATIIAYEKMTAFAAITILDVSLKLGIVLLLPYAKGDKLTVYALCMVMEAFLVRIVYGLYCKIKFRQISFIWVREKALFKEMMGFAGWSTVGNAALVCNTQGLNLILNVVGGPVVNAARAVAFQVQTAITAFTASFQTAVNPQITKSYAGHDLEAMNKLILRSSKFSFFFLLFIIVPLGLELETILRLWLVKVPEYAVLFTRMLLCVSMIDCVANPMMVGAAATGRIKKYHLIVGGTLLCTLPFAFLAVRFTNTLVVVLGVQLLMTVLAQIFRMRLCRGLYQFSSRRFLQDTFWPIVKVCALSLGLPAGLHIYMADGIVKVLLVGVVNAIMLGISIYYLGLTSGEKEFIRNKICRR